MPARYCFALDLKEDAALMAEYDAWHQRVWPDIVKSIRDAGIESMEIYRVHNRLFMIMETNESFSFETKDVRDKASTTVQAWETLMWRYQQALPFAKPGEKWVRMDKIFTLRNS